MRVRSAVLLVVAFACACAGSACFLAGESGPDAKLVAGGSHTCELIDGDVSCWGNNRSGQVGLGTTEELFLTKTEAVTLGEPATDIALGDAHTCAVGESGAVYCWGDNEDGQLGYETVRGFSRSPEVVDMPEAKAIGAGTDHTCAVLTNGGVRCWGANYGGQLGNGEFDDHHVAFVERAFTVEIVAGLRDIEQVEGGANSTCAITTARELYCWGYVGLDNGQELRPVQVDGLPGPVQSVAAGEDHICALVDPGDVYCWGSGFQGQIGDGLDTFADSRKVPVLVEDLQQVVSLTAGTAHTCALDTSGTVSCWGFNVYGQLGVISQHNCLGSEPCQLDPEVVENLPADDLVSITGGGNHTCVLLRKGSSECWGLNSSGQLGDGTGVDSLDPVMVLSATAPVEQAPSVPTASVDVARAGHPSTLAAGENHNCDITEGVVICWGSNKDGAVGVDYTTDEEYSVPLKETSIDLGEPAIELALGRNHTCALGESGLVYCWGSNRWGQLGAETSSETSNEPVVVAGLSGVLAIGGGDQHTCAILDTGALRCWGRNFAGQLGNGQSSDDGHSNLDVQIASVGGISSVIQVDGGQAHTCALNQAGEVYCWGSNEFGKLGDGTDLSHSRPQLVLGLPERAVAIALGDEHSCALVEDGTMYCWGQNIYGQLGYGAASMFDQINGAPRQVPGLQGITHITAGEFHNCAVVNKTDIHCWGFNDWGQLGYAEHNVCFGDPCELEPRMVEALSDSGELTVISGGGRHTCALFADGTESCWGNNDSGELGDGTNVSTHEPVAVLTAGEEEASR